MTASNKIKPGDKITVGIRPEMLTILYVETDKADNVFSGMIVSASYYGDMTYYEVELKNTDINVTVSMRNTSGRPVLRAGTTARVGWGCESITVFDG